MILRCNVKAIGHSTCPDLWVVASKGQMDEPALRELAGKVLPG